ncbi:PQQ-binding-like beta-propeller repeat protein [Candidatus Woesearchaeota archaeon]|nr:PQQ-binding-like beta-propeller repeat protein [Candidatus Woesearchaeota archaeon]
MESTTLMNRTEKNTDTRPEKTAEMAGAKESLKSFILNNAIVWGSGVGEGGKPHKRSVDTKQIFLNPEYCSIAAQLYYGRLVKYDFDYVGGMTMAAHLVTASLVYLGSLYGKNFEGFMMRKEQKHYGMLKQIEGNIKNNSKVVIVDDVLSGGKFAIRTIQAVEAMGCKVEAVICLINYEIDDNKYLLEQGYNVESIFMQSELGLSGNSRPKHPGLYRLKWKLRGINATDYSAPKSTPFVNKNGIYIGSDQSKIMAVDFDGKVKWEFRTDFHEHGVHSSPIVVKGKVICPGYDGNLYSLDETDGRLIWKSRLSDFIGGSPAYDPELDRIYIELEHAYRRGALACVDFETGELLWEFTTPEYTPGIPIIFQDKVIFGCNDHCLYCLDKHDGKMLWKFRAYGELKNGKSVDAETGFAYATSFDGHVYCIDVGTGKLNWKRKLGYKLHSRPLLWKDRVIVSSISNQMTAMDKKSGKVLWYFTTRDSVTSSPFEHGGIVYAGSADRNIYAIGAKSGEFIWKYETEGTITSSPRVFGDCLYVVSNDSYLYCFGKSK